MAEKANIVINYEKEWFEENAIKVAILSVANMKNAFAMEPEFARFQNEEDAEMFRRIVKIIAV